MNMEAENTNQPHFIEVGGATQGSTKQTLPP